MTRTILKYPLQVTDRQTVALPRGAKVLSVQDQRGILCLWALVATDAEIVNVDIRIHGTGHELPDDASAYAHLGTVQQGQYVWHVFKVQSVGELAMGLL